MSAIEDRQKRSLSRRRNYVAKQLREDPQFRSKRIERKRKFGDDGDYDLLDEWLGRSGKYTENNDDNTRSESYEEK